MLGTSIEEVSSAIPDRFDLKQNYPNPFNPTTTIEYSIPNRSFVVITIFNVLGQDVRKLVNEFKDKGVYKMKWDGMVKIIMGTRFPLLYISTK